MRFVVKDEVLVDLIADCGRVRTLKHMRHAGQFLAIEDTPDRIQWSIENEHARVWSNRGRKGVVLEPPVGRHEFYGSHAGACGKCHRAI